MQQLFFATVILIYSGFCSYIGFKFFFLLRFLLPGMKAIAFWLPFALLCYSFIILTFIRSSRLSIFRLAGSFWSAALLYLLLSFVVFDLLRLVLRLCGKNPSSVFSAACTLAAVFLCVITLASGALHARTIHAVNYKINLPGQGSGLRIALASDLHIGSTIDRAWVGRMVDAVNRTEPDIVLLAGDIFEGNIDIVKDMPGIIGELRRIQAPMGVYACLGNHDVDRFFGGGSTERIEAILLEAGIIVLLDEVLAVGETLYIAGRRDARPIGMNVPRKSASQLLAGLDRGKALIVLDHQPTEFPQIEEAGADMLVCGHTHSGQLFPANLITRSIFKRAGGTHYGYWQGKTMKAVVTSGIGIWGPPLRVGTNCEVAVIDIEFN
jgi:predicted MPP superfamily phosphohydrolase